ncbi:MAG: rRNA pseudouridine synthase [Chloroflexi bacterium]|nr:rRNA pseudouridine synthase [Chloroflexota bacterium]
MKERLQKILARAGYGSRRTAERLLTSGRVSVNGVRVAALGSQADASVDRIEVDGRRIQVPTEHVYLALHKPAGIVSTARDTHGRSTVLDLLPPGLPPHVLPVGRLDRDTEGLLLFTNDGEFAHRLSHPRYEIEKEYYALVTGVPPARSLTALRRGVDIGGHVTAPAVVEIATAPFGRAERDSHTWLRIVIHEGRKRQVRLMCAVVGHPVRELVRIRIGPLPLGRLPRGSTRPLTARELAAVRAAVGLA